MTDTPDFDVEYVTYDETSQPTHLRTADRGTAEALRDHLGDGQRDAMKVAEAEELCRRSRKSIYRVGDLWDWFELARVRGARGIELTAAGREAYAARERTAGGSSTGVSASGD